MVKYTGRGLVVKRPEGLSKVQLLNLILGVGVFSLLPTKPWFKRDLRKVRRNRATLETTRLFPYRSRAISWKSSPVPGNGDP